MNNGPILFPSLVMTALLAMPLAAWADRNPDFDDDATPILRTQPQLVEYVHAHFDVKDTGAARIPGDEDHHPQPPFIFQARPRDSDGPYFIRLLVQPGPPGHILKVVDMRTVRLPSMGAPPRPNPDYPAQEAPTASGPTVSVGPADSQPPVQSQPAPSAASTVGVAPPAATQPITSDTPSGPIPDSAASSSSLAPPPDPAPSAQ